MYDVRLYISKTGLSKYVSHLDMFRLMQRAVRRADIPLWYTEGFNPHPYISFLQALPLGVESAREPCDIRIMTGMKPQEIKERLNAVMPGDFRIADAVVPFNKPSDIAWSEYEFEFSPAVITAEELSSVLSSDDLTCEKTGKSGRQKVTKEIPVNEHIAKFTVREDCTGDAASADNACGDNASDPAACGDNASGDSASGDNACGDNASAGSGKTVILNVTVSAGTQFNLSPANLLNAISRKSGREVTADRICRIAFLTADFSLFE